MAETAARLVDRIWPERRARQWVLSLPFELRLRVAFDRALLGELLGIFTTELRADLRRRAAALGLARGDTGTVTHIQRFGGSLNLNVHFHTLALARPLARCPARRARSPGIAPLARSPACPRPAALARARRRSPAPGR